MVATSRHGLFSLFGGDKPLLSCHDLNIGYCQPRRISEQSLIQTNHGEFVVLP